MKLRVALLVFAAIAAARAENLPDQPANQWRLFTKTDGLCESACKSVTLAASGDLLVGHPNTNSISVLDGYGVTLMPNPEANRGRIYESPGGQFWAITGEGLVELQETNWVLHPVDEIAQQFHADSTSRISLLPVRQGRVLILLPDRLLQFDAKSAGAGQVEILHRADRFEIGRLREMTSARDGGLWIVAERGFVKLNGPVRNLQPDEAWAALIPPPELRVQDFSALQENESKGFSAFAETMTGGKALVYFDGERWSANELKLEDVRLAWRGAGKSWILTKDALLERDGFGGTVRHDEISAHQIFDVAVESGDVFWLATSDGLYRHTPAIWETSAVAPKLDNHLVPSRLPEEIAKFTDWQTSLAARNGDVWLGADLGIAWRHRNSWRIFSSTNQIGPEQVIGFAEAPDGRICCATPDKIWEFDGQNWLTLRSGFGQVNALCFARDGTLWIASNSGVHRYVRGAWVQNDSADGLLSSTVTNVIADSAGQIFALMNNGISVLQPDADRDAPRTFIRPLPSDEQTVREGATVKLTFGGRDKWKITADNRLLFSFRLDEREWSPFQESSDVMFSDLPVGKHYFQVRAMDRNANMDTKPARLEFSVVVPWFREARLVWILTGALAVAIFFAALAFNRHRKLRLSYAEVERKIAERTQELELANRELLQSQKMNALGTLAAGIAHDFNNILSIIKGSSQIIEDHLDDPGKVRTRLDRIRTVVQQGAGIVEAMLGFSRGSAEQTEPCDVNAVVNDTLKLLGDRFLREVEIQFEPGAELPKVSVARDFVQQVLLNFIFNAAEAMTERKQIHLATKKLERLPPGMVLSPAGVESYVAIVVKDFGSGISAENLPRIFEPFFTTKALSARRGTGLGLSMVYELAKKIGAGLAVETIEGAGSTFTIFLPVQKEPVGETKPETATHR